MTHWHAVENTPKILLASWTIKAQYFSLGWQFPSVVMPCKSLFSPPHQWKHCRLSILDIKPERSSSLYSFASINQPPNLIHWVISFRPSTPSRKLFYNPDYLRDGIFFISHLLAHYNHLLFLFQGSVSAGKALFQLKATLELQYASKWGNTPDL